MWPNNKGLPYYFRNPRRSRTGIPVFIPTMTNNSAPIYRSAITLLMSYVRDKPVVDQHLHLSIYFTNARKCIERGAIVELIYASYIVASYSLIGGEAINEAIHKVGMFAQGASIFIDKECIQGEELWWIETLWQNLLLALYSIQHETVGRGVDHRPLRIYSTGWSTYSETAPVSYPRTSISPTYQLRCPRPPYA